jgi:hypothetical protein
LFTREAVTLIHDCAHGIPRTINVMCDNALVTGLALGRQPVDREIVLEVSRDFALRAETTETSQEGDVQEPATGELPRHDEVLTEAPERPQENRELFQQPPARATRFPLFGFGRR